MFAAREIVALTVRSPDTNVTGAADEVVLGVGTGVGDEEEVARAVGVGTELAEGETLGLAEGEGLEEAVATVEGAGLGLGVGDGVPGAIVTLAGAHTTVTYGGAVTVQHCVPVGFGDGVALGGNVAAAAACEIFFSGEVWNAASAPKKIAIPINICLMACPLAAMKERA